MKKAIVILSVIGMLMGGFIGYLLLFSDIQVNGLRKDKIYTGIYHVGDTIKAGNFILECVAVHSPSFYDSRDTERDDYTIIITITQHDEETNEDKFISRERIHRGDSTAISLRDGMILQIHSGECYIIPQARPDWAP